jgi:hypothetical protein
MGIFTRKSRLPRTDGLVLDRTWSDRELDAAVAAVEVGDFDTALAGFKAQTGDRRAVWNGGLAEAAIGRSEQLEARLEELGGRDPELLVWLAQTLVLEGWRVRSGQQAKYVSEQQFATFHDILRTAYEVVGLAIETAPDDATPWTVYQWVAIGLGADLETHEALFQEAIARHPASYAAHGNKVHAIAPKWYGNSLRAACSAPYWPRRWRRRGCTSSPSPTPTPSRRSPRPPSSPPSGRTRCSRRGASGCSPAGPRRRRTWTPTTTTPIC